MNVMADKKKRNLTSTKRAMLRWTGKEIDQLLEYKATGFKHSEIGELMGRSTKSINVKMSKIRLGVEAANNPVEDLTPFQKNLDETLFGGVSPDDKPRKPRKPRATKLSLTPKPLVTDTFNVPKKPVYAAVVLVLVIVAWYLGSMS
jgi:hypothetical protein